MQEKAILRRCCVCRRQMNIDGLPMTNVGNECENIGNNFWANIEKNFDVSDGICEECYPKERERVLNECKRLKELALE